MVTHTMKVLLINGSPRKQCTYTALCEVASSLNQEGIETEIYSIGAKPVAGCIGCWKCRETGKCIQKDFVNDLAEKAKEFDGFIFGAPVYYASPNGSMLALLDRLYASASKTAFSHKPCGTIVSARRAGTSASLDALNKYPLINEQPLIGSQYWNMVHGSTIEDVKQDLEGMQVMRVLGKNMAWMLKAIEAGKNAGIMPPVLTEEPQRTNFIR